MRTGAIAAREPTAYVPFIIITHGGRKQTFDHTRGVKRRFGSLWTHSRDEPVEGIAGHILDSLCGDRLERKDTCYDLTGRP